MCKPKTVVFGLNTLTENSNKSFQQTSVAFSFWKSMQDLKVFLPNKVCLSVSCYLIFGPIQNAMTSI